MMHKVLWSKFLQGHNFCCRTEWKSIPIKLNSKQTKFHKVHLVREEPTIAAKNCPNELQCEAPGLAAGYEPRTKIKARLFCSE